MDAGRVAQLAARAVQEKKGREPVILDLRGITLIADYFVIASGTSTVQVQAIANQVEESLATAGVELLHREGLDAARWVLLDFGAVVVHIFLEEERRFYDLERLWGDARKVALANE
ncbi:ribosome silencing factor [Moorella naiadis]|uniref:ribosome silencing factor n=1 Tax=Moorella naiadis (nom. illeg.) TaxID=3093670 RepID=UPI003D9C860D